MKAVFTSPHAELGKFSRESPYWAVTARGVQCRICPHNCILADGRHGLCRTHVAKDGKLYTTAYGNPCAVHADPIEKKPLFHYLPASSAFSVATAGCNFACLNCQNREISGHSPAEMANGELFPAEVVAAALESGCQSIAYTYSEPVAFYEYMYDTARLAQAGGVKNLLISNGYIHEKPLRDLCIFLDAANIDLKSFSAETYVKLTGGRLEPVLETLKILKEAGVWLEITNLVIPHITDDPAVIRRMCEWLVINGFADNPLHFSRFHPLNKLSELPYTPQDVLEKARTVAMETGIRYVYIGNVPGTSAENTYCPECKNVVIERRGFRVHSMNLNDGRCIHCQTGIAGVWE
jgi:pyruvate formate lyase activating enzyme